jgi:hypothetical protein
MEDEQVGLRERVLIVAMVEPGKPDPLTILHSIQMALGSISGVSDVEISQVGNVPMSAKTFKGELERLLNSFSQENASNTPDFILASLLKQTLDTWNLHTRERDRWWGNRSTLGVGNDAPAVPTSEQSLLR